VDLLTLLSIHRNNTSSQPDHVRSLMSIIMSEQDPTDLNCMQLSCIGSGYLEFKIYSGVDIFGLGRIVVL